MFAAGCSGEQALAPPETIRGEEIETTYDPLFEFPTRGTYLFFHPAGELEQYTPQMKTLIRNLDSAFSLQLREKGFKPSQPLEKADFLIDYHLLLEQTLYLITEQGRAAEGRWTKISGLADDVISGTLDIEITDTQSGRIVWQGKWRANIAAKPLMEDGSRHQFRYAAGQLMRTFPPK
jgi:hypothetical protein